jgi:hypothetical protein
MCEVLGKKYAKVLSVNELQRKGTGKQHFLLTTGYNTVFVKSRLECLTRGRPLLLLKTGSIVSRCLSGKSALYPVNTPPFSVMCYTPLGMKTSFGKDSGALRGRSLRRGGSVRLATYGVKSFRSFAKQNSTRFGKAGAWGRQIAATSPLTYTALFSSLKQYTYRLFLRLLNTGSHLENYGAMRRPRNYDRY